MNISKVDIELWLQSDVTKYFFDNLKNIRKNYQDSMSHIDIYAENIERSAIIYISKIQCLNNIIELPEDFINDNI